jgi:UTP--glucose-1-phosphate uridylyltransferase
MNLTQAILPVAGLGTRFLPWTKVVPKELLPIGNEPIIAKIVDECLAVGIDDVCFVINRGKESIAEYFYANPALEEELKRRGKLHQLEQLQRYDNVRFHIVYQEDQLGDGHAIMQARKWAKSDHIAVLFGDDLFAASKPGLKQLKDAYEKYVQEPDGAIIALENVSPENVSKYGIVNPEWSHKDNERLRKLKGLVEKPKPEDAPSTLGIVGRYIIPKSTFDILPTVENGEGGEIRLIDALIKQLGQGMAIYGYECDGIRLDTGRPEGYQRAIKILSELKE